MAMMRCFSTNRRSIRGQNRAPPITSCIEFLFLIPERLQKSDLLRLWRILTNHEDYGQLIAVHDDFQMIPTSE
jgi:hypothetical protein